LGDGDGEYGTIEFSQEQDLREFDHDKRVAVSVRGYVIVNRSNRLVVVPTRQNSRNFQIAIPNALRGTRDQQLEMFEFLDIAINDSGNLLYAWASFSISRVLIVYQLINVEEMDTPVALSCYDYKTNEEDKDTRLFPYNDWRGCIIAASGFLFFPGIIEGVANAGAQGQTPERNKQPRHISAELRASPPRAARMFNDHSLIAVQKGTRHALIPLPRPNRLVEYALKLDKGGPHLESGKEMIELKERAGEGSAVQVVRALETVLVLVCHVNGKVELVQFPPSVAG